MKRTVGLMFAMDKEEQHSKVVKSPDKVLTENWKTSENRGRNMRRKGVSP